VWFVPCSCFALSTCMSWHYPDFLTGRSSLLADPSQYVGGRSSLTIIQAMPSHIIGAFYSYVSWLRYPIFSYGLLLSADNSPIHTRIRLHVLSHTCVLTSSTDISLAISSPADYQAKIIWLWIWLKSGVNTSPPVLEYERFMLRSSINPKLPYSDWCKLLHYFNLLGGAFS
jgi:hypothetical protein